MMKNVLCIKWGDLYGADYVNQLYEGVRRYLRPPFRFVCLTERPEGIDPDVEVFALPHLEIDETAMLGNRSGSLWRKIGLFEPGLANLEGPTLFLDLDLVVMGSLDTLFEHSPGKFVIIHDWREQRLGTWGGNTSVFRFDPARHHFIHEEFLRDQSRASANHRHEQNFVTEVVRQREELVYWPDLWVKSFKRHCRHPFPFNLFRSPIEPECSVLVFHGMPNPPEASRGFLGNGFRSTRPAAWLRKYWRLAGLLILGSGAAALHANSIKQSSLNVPLRTQNLLEIAPIHAGSETFESMDEEWEWHEFIEKMLDDSGAPHRDLRLDQDNTTPENISQRSTEWC